MFSLYLSLVFPPLSTLRAGRRWQNQLHVNTDNTLNFYYGSRWNTTRHHWGGDGILVLFLLELPAVSGRFLSLRGCHHLFMSTAWQGCELKMGLTGLSVMRAYTGVCLHSSWANPQSQRFRWLGWPQLTDWEIPCFQKLFQTLLLLQAYWFYCHSQRITSDITRELSKEASRVLILLLDWALSLHNLSNYCFKTVTRIIGWLSISLMNAILHRAHSSGNKHIPALPLALSANSCLKNLLTSELWMFLRMTWGPPAHQPHRNSLGDTDESLGEPRDEQFSPWPHWHNNKASVDFTHLGSCC